MIQTTPDAGSLEPRFTVLFDIDGTLVTGPEHGPSAGLLAMNRVAALLTGVDDTGDPKEFAGRTDIQIARLLLQSAGEPAPTREQVDLLVAHYVEGLAEFVERAPYTALGDPATATRELRARGGVVGLGTGNVRAGAAIKLESAKILDLFDLELGGFGGDGETRAEVLLEGRLRCDPSGRLPLIVVGDTPRDVSAALEIGALCVGTPYRRNTAQILYDAGAHAVVEGLGPDLVATIGRLLSAI